jgi:hypothetical protein
MTRVVGCFKSADASGCALGDSAGRKNFPETFSPQSGEEGSERLELTPKGSGVKEGQNKEKPKQKENNNNEDKTN